VCEKLPSQKSSTSSPATAPENLVVFDGAKLTREIILLQSPATAPENLWWQACSPLGTSRGRFDEYSSKIFPQLETKVYRSSRGETNDWRWCLLACDSSGQFIGHLVQALPASCNMEPAHTQPNTLFPTCDEVVNLTDLLETKGMSIPSGKQ
jgi:hypothetical protein